MTSSNAGQDELGWGSPDAVSLAPDDDRDSPPVAQLAQPPPTSPSQLLDHDIAKLDAAAGEDLDMGEAPATPHAESATAQEHQPSQLAQELAAETEAAMGQASESAKSSHQIDLDSKASLAAADRLDQAATHARISEANHDTVAAMDMDDPTPFPAMDDSMGGMDVDPNNPVPFLSASDASLVRSVMPPDSQQAHLALALAQLSARPIAPAALSRNPGTTVAPAQINLSGDSQDGVAGAYPYSGKSGLESYAQIEFPDSTFQMTTYAVVIGRDNRALKQARKDEKRQEEHRKLVQFCAEQGLPPPDPVPSERNLKFSKSYVSEEGGMLGPESDGASEGRPPAAKRRKTGSTGSPQDEPEEFEEPLIRDRQYVSHTPGAAAVDLDYLRPSPHHVPFIGIHSPGPDIAKKTKAISRKHVRIEFDRPRNLFVATPLHSNGFFCDNVLYCTEPCVLKSGSELQIKDVYFTFVINGVERGCTGAEDLDERPSKRRKRSYTATHDDDDDHPSSRRYSEGGKEMSVDFENLPEGEDSSSARLSELEGSPSEPSPAADMDLDNAASEEDGMGEATTAKQGLDGPPKRRGPGRPPKDGIMSKRERKELNRKAQEEERKKQLESQESPTEPPIKRKVGRPRKNPVPEEADKGEKRKYKPRKPKEEGEENSDAEKRRERKERKMARPKSPPLSLRREDFTEEQLAKPNKNYGVLIDEVLTEAGAEGLALKQIYKRISLKYPFYYFFTETKGWESSVRHNLIGNSAFKKLDETGNWTRVHGIELDAGKKKKGESATAVQRAPSTTARGLGPTPDASGYQLYDQQAQLGPAQGQGGSMTGSFQHASDAAGGVPPALRPDSQSMLQGLSHLAGQPGALNTLSLAAGLDGGSNRGSSSSLLPNGGYPGVQNGVNGASQYIPNQQQFSQQTSGHLVSSAARPGQGAAGHADLEMGDKTGAMHGFGQINRLIAPSATGGQAAPSHIAGIPRMPPTKPAVSNTQLQKLLAAQFLDLVESKKVSPLICLRGITRFLGLGGFQVAVPEQDGLNDTVNDVTEDAQDVAHNDSPNLSGNAGEIDEKIPSPDAQGEALPQGSPSDMVPTEPQLDAQGDVLMAEPPVDMENSAETGKLNAYQASHENEVTTAPSVECQVDTSMVAQTRVQEADDTVIDQEDGDAEDRAITLEEAVSRIFESAVSTCQWRNPADAQLPLVEAQLKRPLLAICARLKALPSSELDQVVSEFVVDGSFCTALGLFETEPGLWWLKDEVPADVLESWTQKLVAGGGPSRYTLSIRHAMLSLGFFPPPPPPAAAAALSR